MRNTGRGSHAVPRQLPVDDTVRALRRGAGDHAVEFTADHGSAEGRAAPQAARSSSSRPRSRHRRPWNWAASRWRRCAARHSQCRDRAGIPHRQSAGAAPRAHGVLHRRHRHRPRHRARRGRQAHAPRWSWAASHACSRDADLDAAIDGVIGAHLRRQRPVLRGRLAPVRAARHRRILHRPAGRARAGCAWICRTRARRWGRSPVRPPRKIEGMVDAAPRRRRGRAGRTAPGPGSCGTAFYLPTILSGLARDATVVREEIFGPCCARWPSRTRTT